MAEPAGEVDLDSVIDRLLEGMHRHLEKTWSSAWYGTADRLPSSVSLANLTSTT